MNAEGLLTVLGETAMSVLVAVLPLTVLFLVFQIFMLNLPLTDVRKILIGTALSGTGLFLFLLGVGLGFMPAGHAIGVALGSTSHKWLLFPAGVFLGFVTTWSEPAVRILADQVEEASNGSIHKNMVLTSVAVGVAIWVGLGLVRIGYQIPLLYLLVPGYLVVLAIMWFSGDDFVGVAVDAGGVATGPMANTFLLALALGAAEGSRQDPFVYGLGLVALIALAPVVSVMVMGLLIRFKSRKQE